MSRACVLTALGLGILCAVSSPAASLRLEGEPYRPNAPITWAATNVFPKRLSIYRASSQGLSQAVVSNAMSIGSFTFLNRMPWPDKTVMQFQDKRENMTRSLTIAPAQGSISYYDGLAGGAPMHGVPTAAEADKVVLAYFQRLGGDTNQIFPKRRQPREGTMASLDKKSGRESEPVVYTRGITLDRQIEGIKELGSSFMIDFGNEGKPMKFELKWKKLEPQGAHEVGTRDRMIEWMKAGRAVVAPSVADPVAVPAKPKSLTITKAVLYYAGRSASSAQETVYPYAQLEVVADVEVGEKAVFYLNCPVIDIESP